MQYLETDAQRGITIVEQPPDAMTLAVLIDRAAAIPRITLQVPPRPEGGTGRARAHGMASDRNVLKGYNDNGVPIMKLFSAFGAADLLEKDRQTVRRALRHVAPDGFEGKNPRWRLPTIIAALDAHLGRNTTPTPPAASTLQVMFDQFDGGCRNLAMMPDLKARRSEAHRLIALLVELDRAMRTDARARREDELRASLRCDQHFRLAMRNFEQPCEWSHDQCWKVLTAISDEDKPSQGRANVKQVRQ